MGRTMTMTVRLSGPLSDFVAANVGENGDYESISEYVRDLIRRDKARSEQEAFDRPPKSRGVWQPGRSWNALSQRRTTPTRAADRRGRNRAKRGAARRMTPVRVQRAAAVRIEEIYRYSRERWGEEQAQAYV